MKKHLRFLLLLALATSATGQLQAQKTVSLMPDGSQHQYQRITSEQRAKLSEVAALRLSELRLPKAVTPPSQSSSQLAVSRSNRVVTGKSPEVSPLAANILKEASARSSKIYAHIQYAPGYTPGIYEITPPTEPNGALGLRLIFAGDSNTLPLVASAGIVGDNYYLIGWDPATYAFGWLQAHEYVIDLLTGEKTVDQDLGAQQYQLVALETAQAADGTVYGQFYNDNKGKSYTWGTIDLTTHERTVIGSSTQRAVAMAVGNDGTLYYIGEDGNLFTINKSTGKETLVGPTGVTVDDSRSNYWTQSGEIDPNTNTFWWFAIDADQNSNLYTVDLTTGHATLVSQLDKGTYPTEVTGVIIPAPAAADAAPDAVTDLALNFEGASTTGTVSFTAPSKNYAGATLSGELNYYVVADGDTLATGTANAGEHVDATVTVPTDGEKTFYVTTSNAAGSSPHAKASYWVGYDVPAAVGNLNLTIDNSTSSAHLTWDASATVLHNGYLGKVTYNVYRILDGQQTLVSSNQEATSFDEQLSKDGTKKYSYKVEAVNGDKVSSPAFSNGVVLADAWSVPYDDTFGGDNPLDNYTVIDANGDGYTWAKAAYYQNTIEYYLYSYPDVHSADDWFITPPIALSKDYQYRFNLKTRASGLQPARIEVKLGKGNSAADMTQLVLDSTNVDSWNAVTLEKGDVSVDEDGVYFFGIHAIDDPEYYAALDVQEISVKQAASKIGPAAATDFEVHPDQAGDLRAMLTCSAPTVNVDSTAITSPLKAVFTRNGQNIGEVDNVNAGQSVNLVDDKDGITNGYNTYTVTFYSGDNEGQLATVKAWIGDDYPYGVKNIKFADNQTTADVSWDATSTVGQNGGVVNLDKVKYDVWSCDWNELYNAWHTKEILTTTPDTAVTVNIPNTDEGDQTLSALAVGVVNPVANSDKGYPYYVANVTEYVSGKPYAFPFSDSFAQGATSNYWSFNRSNSAVSVGYTSDASDGDQGAVASTSTQGGDDVNSVAGTGKISLAGARQPALSFYAKSTDAADNIDIAVLKPNGTVDTLATAVSLGTSYGLHKIDLSDYKDQRYIRIFFQSNFRNPGTIQFDNVKVAESVANDLQLKSLDVPATVTAGGTADIAVDVLNQGSEPASNYDVVVRANDQDIFSQTVSDTLAPGAERVFNVAYPTSVFDNPGNVSIYAEVAYDADENSDNDNQTATLSIVASDAKGPENLTGNNQGDSVVLDWTSPVQTPKSVTEDFEDQSVFEPFSIGGITATDPFGKLGDWTVYNADGHATFGIDQVDYDNNAAPQAFTVWNPGLLGDALKSSFGAHSGEQALLSFDNSTDGLATDHWLISPELSGSAQTISFYYNELSNNYGNEKFIVLASSTNKDAGSFVPLDTIESGTQYQQASVELPQGTRYFAIEHVSTNAWGLLLDDFEYQVGASHVKGYNIYVDGKLVGQAGTDDQEYTIPNLSDGDHTFAVTAVYDNGEESSPVTLTLTVNGIDELVVAPGEKFNVYTVDGKLVRKDATSLDGLHGAYVIKDKKVVLK